MGLVKTRRLCAMQKRLCAEVGFNLSRYGECKWPVVIGTEPDAI